MHRPAATLTTPTILNSTTTEIPSPLTAAAAVPALVPKTAFRMLLYADWSLSLTNESASPLLMARAVRPLKSKLKLKFMTR